jgi:hypothetical protein
MTIPEVEKKATNKPPGGSRRRKAGLLALAMHFLGRIRIFDRTDRFCARGMVFCFGPAPFFSHVVRLPDNKLTQLPVETSKTVAIGFSTHVISLFFLITFLDRSGTFYAIANCDGVQEDLWKIPFTK